MPTPQYDDICENDNGYFIGSIICIDNSSDAFQTKELEVVDGQQTLLGYLTDDYSTQERFFRQYYNAFKNRLNEPFRTDGQRKKDPLGYIATRSNLLSIFEELISRDLSGFMSDILVCGEI